MSGTRVSVVICLYNQPSASDRAVRRALETTGPETEVLLVYNHPPYPDARRAFERLCRLERVRAFDPGQNLGPFRGSHLGMLQARGEMVVKLNDDLLVPPGWHVAMEQALRRHPELAYVALPWTAEQASPTPGPGQRLLEGPGYRVKVMPEGVLFGCVMLSQELWRRHFTFDVPGFYSGAEEALYAGTARALGRAAGYVVSHPTEHLARTPWTDPLYGVWKVLAANGHPPALEGDFGRWKSRLADAAERARLLDAAARKLLVDFGYPAEEVDRLAGSPSP